MKTSAPAMRSNENTDCRDDYPQLCQTHPNWALFLVSVLGLYIELLLIRWIGTEIRIFAYLQNTVLVVCFLGLGMGCFTCRRPVAMRELLVPLLVILTLFAIPFTRQGLGQISEMLSLLPDLVIWFQPTGRHLAHTAGAVALGLFLTLALMLLVWMPFVPIGRLIGRLIDDHPNTIAAYSINVAGSLVGIWGFVLLSVFFQPPLTWFAVTALLVLPLVVGRCPKRTDLIMLLAIVGLSWPAGWERDALSVYWSPYQKLVLKNATSSESPDVSKYIVTVNNVGYQVLYDLGESNRQRLTPPDPDTLWGYGQYDIPCLVHPNPRRMLIVGAGAGNDVAGALRHGVPEVIAVEIDPAIIAIGEAHHPEDPYSRGAVTVVQDDARSFFATCGHKYDVISFGLLDSHTMTSAMTNQRLDHYVYTRESVEHAKSLLAPGGVLTLTFDARRSYIADRIARLLQEVFGEPPICFKIPPTEYGLGGVFFIAGDLDQARSQIAADPHLAALIDNWQRSQPLALPETTQITTDDWPYIYLEARRIPVLYYLLAGMMLVLVVICQKLLKARILSARWPRSHWHFFFLGAAFLLLEVQNISKAAVVLGNTWWVNAVIISGVLTMVLLANAIAARFPRLPLAVVYLLLCASCVVLYSLDISRFAFLPYVTKAIIVGGATTLPMLFGGMVFIRSFARVEAKDQALGANLLGALVGGLLQSVTFVTGIKALLLIVTGLYLLAMVTQPRFRSEPPAGPSPEALPA